MTDGNMERNIYWSYCYVTVNVVILKQFVFRLQDVFQVKYIDKKQTTYN